MYKRTGVHVIFFETVVYMDNEIYVYTWILAHVLENLHCLYVLLYKLIDVRMNHCTCR